MPNVKQNLNYFVVLSALPNQFIYRITGVYSTSQRPSLHYFAKHCVQLVEEGQMLYFWSVVCRS